MKHINLFKALKYARVLCPFLPTKVSALDLGKTLHYILYENIITYGSLRAIREKMMSNYDGILFDFNRNQLIQNTFNNGKVLSLCVVKFSSELHFERFSDNSYNNLK